MPQLSPMPNAPIALTVRLQATPSGTTYLLFANIALSGVLIATIGLLSAVAIAGNAAHPTLIAIALNARFAVI